MGTEICSFLSGKDQTRRTVTWTGWADLTSGLGGGWVENRGDETGGGDEEREDCVLGNTRLGKERQLPQVPLEFTHVGNPDFTPTDHPQNRFVKGAKIGVC